MTTTAPTTTTIDPIPCPSWCTCGHLPLHVHDWCWTGEGVVRDHDGPSFGEHVDVNGQQRQAGRCIFAVAVEVPDNLTVDQARDLASSLLQAAEWIEAQA